MTSPETGLSRPIHPASFRLVEEICRRAFGFRLLTVLRHKAGQPEIERVYSSQPETYPIGIRKPMGATPWGKIVLDQGQGWWGEGEQTIRWAFPDATKILSLGCESCLCAPVLDRGQVIAVLSLNDAQGAYRPEDLDPLGVIAQSLKQVV